jgi:primosomal protein DnaI
MRQTKDQIYKRKNGLVVDYDIITRMKKVDMLMLDDLGNEYITEYNISEVLQNVLDYRYKYEKATIITSNYTLDELFEMYAEVVGGQRAAQIVTRIKTFGAIEMKGKSWR